MARAFGDNTFEGVSIDAEEREHHLEGMVNVVTYYGQSGGHYRSNNLVANNDGHPHGGIGHFREVESKWESQR